MAAILHDTPNGDPYQHVPIELKQLRQWVVWKYVTKESDGKPTKVPFQPNDHEASTTNRRTWSSFDEVCAVASRYEGIGFVFAAGGGIYGFDADRMYDPRSGKINADAEYWLRALNTYTELSPSRIGIHAIGFGSLPGEGKNPHDSPFELYDSGRFFTVTGEWLEGFPVNLQPATPVILSDLWTTLSRHEVESAPLIEGEGASFLSDEEVIERAGAAVNGDAFRALWDGDTSRFAGDDSSADLSLCNRLAWWCNKDAAQIDRLFRRSGLMRPKWDMRRGNGTYGSRTIMEAIRVTSGGYSPKSVVQLVKPSAGGHRTPPPGTDPLTGEVLDTAPKKYEFTDTGNADRFADSYADTYLYKLFGEETGSWLRWDGRRWSVTAGCHVRDDAKAVTRDMLESAVRLQDDDQLKAIIKHALKSQQKERLTAMVELARGRLAASANDFDTDPWLLNCENGVVDLHTGTLRGHDRRDRITRMAPVSYDAHARCPQFTEFLERIVPEADVRAFMQRAIGYGLTGLTREQSLFFLYGSGSNGKSTLLNIIRRLMGDYAAHTGSETLMSRREGAQTNDLAALQGARFVTTVEVEDGRRMAESLVKELTGGDPITVKFLYKEFFTYTPVFKIFLAANHKPVIRGQDNGIWRRIRLIPFTAHIEDAEKDPNLGDKLWEERAGILAWAVCGCMEWQVHGLQAPDVVKDATQEYRNEMDVLASFLEEICILESDAAVSRAALFRAYGTWCEQNKERAYTQRAFAIKLNERGFGTHMDGNGVRMWCGVKLKYMPETES
jgi:putative DNA primase/helicase